MDTTDPAVPAGQPAPAPTRLSPDAKAVTLLAAIEEPSIGPSTILSGAVTIAGFGSAAAAILDGAHDAITITTATVGVIGLVVFVTSRVVQVVAAIKAAR